MDIDVTNKYLVGRQQSLIFVGMPAKTYSRRDALLLAAWIVALADDDPDITFADILKAVENA